MAHLCEACGVAPAMGPGKGRYGYFCYCRPCLDAKIAAEVAPTIERRKQMRMKTRRTVAEKRLFVAAHRFVAIAIRNGFLDVLDGTQVCVDCGAIATVYEHRDYGRPLDVEPVCRACNGRRGMGAMPPRVIATTD